jgi:hypothetical protein
MVEALGVEPTLGVSANGTNSKYQQFWVLPRRLAEGAADLEVIRYL